MTSPVPAPEHSPGRPADGKLGADLPAADPAQREQDLGRIYDALAHGRGREWVDEGNVDALVTMAQRAGNPRLELLLREWRSPCGEDAAAVQLPPAVPPPRRSGG
jgi:hypothetical protein